MQATITARQDRADCAGNAHYYLCFRHKIITPDGPTCLWEWPHQEKLIDEFRTGALHIIPKARQLGLTTLVLGYAQWRMLFQPGFMGLFFSRGQRESRDLLKRVSRSLQQLDPHLRPTIRKDNADEIELANGSRVLSFAARGSQGDSFTADLVYIDEADLIDSLDQMLTGAKPTIDRPGGQMILTSRVNKMKVDSPFQRIVRSASVGQSTYRLHFIPWYARPDRTQAWYEEQVKESLERTGNLDHVREAYPATIEEALAPRQSNRRFPWNWLQDVFDPSEGIKDAYQIPGLTVYSNPHKGAKYVIGADPAEGDVHGCDSAASVHRIDEGETRQVATLVGKIEPTTFGQRLTEVGRLYGNAGVLVERNNHGHAVLAEIERREYPAILNGPDGKPGFLTLAQSKVKAFDDAADVIGAANVIIRDRATLDQLSLIQASDLKPPEGHLSDRAIAFVMAIVGASLKLTTFDIVSLR